MKLHKGQRIAWLLIILGLLVGGVVFFTPPGKVPSQLPKAEIYKTYKSSNPALDFTFEYPSAGWTPKESQGSSQKYDAVQVLGPREAKEKYGAYMSVAVRTLTPEQLSADLAEATLNETKRFKGFKALEKNTVKVQGRDCPAVTFEHYLRLPLWKKDATDILIRKTMVFLVKGDRAYRITFAASAGEFGLYQEIFNRALGTFKLKG